MGFLYLAFDKSKSKAGLHEGGWFGVGEGLRMTLVTGRLTALKTALRAIRSSQTQEA